MSSQVSRKEYLMPDPDVGHGSEPHSCECGDQTEINCALREYVQERNTHRRRYGLISVF